MALTRSFKATVKARAERDPEFRKELFTEGVECLLSGDLKTGKAIMRDYINATVGFAELGRVTRVGTKSLMRMFGPSGNPRAANLLKIVAYLQKKERVRLEVRAALTGSR